MSADDFVDQYWNVQAGSTTISMHKYLIGGRFAGAGAGAKQAQQQRVYSLATQNGLGPKASAFTRARNGKVCPDDCTHILTLAVQSGAVKESELQKWADDNLGVDCTGFAVAYYNDLGLIDIERYSGGASCLYLFDKAKRNYKKRRWSAHLVDRRCPKRRYDPLDVRKRSRVEISRPHFHRLRRRRRPHYSFLR